VSSFFPQPNRLPTQGFFGPAPAAPGGVSFSIPIAAGGSTGPSANGPGQSYNGGASTASALNIPAGFFGESPFPINPDPTLINGVALSAFGLMSTSPVNLPPNGLGFVLILAQAGLPQNFFAAVDFTLGDGNVYHLTSASAQLNNPWDDTATGIGFTTWVWPNSLEPFFPPASYPGLIVVS
jgi:hypothetical protein